MWQASRCHGLKLASRCLVSAADGKVLYVRTVAGGTTPMVTKAGRSYPLEELMATNLGQGPVQIIGAAMTFLGVHVTRRQPRLPHGSLVAVVLPVGGGLIVAVKPGDQVTAGVSGLACLGAGEGDQAVEA